MPNYFQLMKKGEKEPVMLNKIDTELWEHFEGAEPENNTRWYKDWYRTIGLAIAMGVSLEDLAAESEIAEYLHKYYDSKAWYSHR